VEGEIKKLTHEGKKKKKDGGRKKPGMGGGGCKGDHPRGGGFPVAKKTKGTKLRGNQQRTGPAIFRKKNNVG